MTSDNLSIFRKIWSLLLLTERRSAVLLLGLMVVGMMLETLGVGLVIQSQRIGIAHALYHDPAVLVLDEATSSLDTATEQSVMEAGRAPQGTKTVIIVTHRLSTVEHGVHREILKKSPARGIC